MGKNKKENLMFDFVKLSWWDRLNLYIKYDLSKEMKYARKFRNM